MNINRLFDPELLAAMLDGGYVRARRHGNLTIYNYTQRAQFESLWNDVTTTCRGLIVDEHGTIVARPLKKFFNLVDHPELPDGPVTFTEKLDGSLGILHRSEDGYRIATRGSFDSSQAAHATGVWRERYAHKFEPEPGLTYLYEIIYPGNRIVVDYQGLDELVLIAVVDNSTGTSVRPEDSDWPGPLVETLPYTSIAEALAATGREGREGMVAHFPDSDLRVKIKHDDYVKLHRIVTDVSDRRIWELLSSGEQPDGWLKILPEGLLCQAKRCATTLTERHAALKNELIDRHQELLAALGDDHPRSAYAHQVARSTWPLARLLFSVRDGKNVDDALWRHLRPGEHRPYYRNPDDI